MAANAEANITHLNFMKKQQWNVAYYAILLLAAVFAVKKAFDPLHFVEWWAGTVLCALVLLLGILLLCFIQHDIGGHRSRSPDATAYARGLEFTIPLGRSIFISFCTVVYALWRDCPCWAQ
jgi:O-antigen/teichoic acid export membrane protein